MAYWIEYCSQVSVAPSRRTMGFMNVMPSTMTTAPNPMARKKAVEMTRSAFSSCRAPRRRAM